MCLEVVEWNELLTFFRLVAVEAFPSTPAMILLGVLSSLVMEENGEFSGLKSF